MDSSTSASKTSENVFHFVFISLFAFFGICRNIRYFSDSVKIEIKETSIEIETSKKKHLLGLLRIRSKLH